MVPAAAHWRTAEQAGQRERGRQEADEGHRDETDSAVRGVRSEADVEGEYRDLGEWVGGACDCGHGIAVLSSC